MAAFDIAIPLMPVTRHPAAEKDLDFSDHIERLTRALLDTPHDEAAQRDLVKEAASICQKREALADRLLGGAARLLGEYWLEDEADFVAVTLATHRLTMLLMQMEEQPQLFDLPPAAGDAGPEGRGKIALMLPPEEQHGFGICMLAFRLRQAGWQVHMTENCSQLIEFVLAKRPVAVGFSAGHTRSITHIDGLAGELRAKCGCQSPSIAFGGAAFATGEDWPAIANADLVAICADDMLHWLNELGEAPVKFARQKTGARMQSN